MEVVEAVAVEVAEVATMVQCLHEGMMETTAMKEVMM